MDCFTEHVADVAVATNLEFTSVYPVMRRSKDSDFHKYIFFFTMESPLEIFIKI